MIRAGERHLENWLGEKQNRNSLWQFISRWTLLNEIICNIGRKEATMNIYREEISPGAVEFQQGLGTCSEHSKEHQVRTEIGNKSDDAIKTRSCQWEGRRGEGKAERMLNNNNKSPPT